MDGVCSMTVVAVAVAEAAAVLGADVSLKPDGRPALETRLTGTLTDPCRLAVT